MRRGSGAAVGIALLALCLVAFVEAGRAAAHGHYVASAVIAGVASLSGLGMLLAQPTGRRR